MSKQNNAKLVPQRPVLILDFNNELHGLEANLIEQNWLPMTTSSLASAMHVIRQTNIHVVIAIISANKYKKDFDAISKLQNIAPSVKWLAISMQYPIISSPYSRKLTTHFVDYFHCPIDWIQFAHTLGHGNAP